MRPPGSDSPLTNDQLNLQVWTDGSLKPYDAIGQAAKILKDHLFMFINFQEEPEEKEPEIDEVTSVINEKLNKSIVELELSVRSYNCLKECQYSDNRGINNKN